MIKNNNKYFIISLIVILIFVVIFFILKYEEPKTKSFELEKQNNIVNFTKNLFYDTILHVGLNELNIKNVNVVVNRIHEAARRDFEGQGGILGAHLKELDNNYYLYIDELSKYETVTVVSHELIHLEQYYSDKLSYSNDTIVWLNKKYGRTELSYENRPWEIEAYKKEKELSKNIRNIIFQ